MALGEITDICNLHSNLPVQLIAFLVDGTIRPDSVPGSLNEINSTPVSLTPTIQKSGVKALPNYEIVKNLMILKPIHVGILHFLSH